MGIGAGLYMCDLVKKFTFAISSPDEFLWCKAKLFMVALCNRADHYIFMLWFVLLLLLLSFFPHLISAAADWMSAILPHMVWP